MGDVVEGGAAGEVPALIAVLVLGMHGEDGGDLAIAGDEVFAGGQGEGWAFHDQAVFLEPPVAGVEFPAGGGDAGGGGQLLEAFEAVAAGAGVQAPEAPGLGAVAGRGAGGGEGGDDLGFDAAELGGVGGEERLREGGGENEGSDGKQPVCLGGHEEMLHQGAQTGRKGDGIDRKEG